MTDTATLYAGFSADLRAWFGRRAPADEVDDLLQEAFLRIHRGLGAVRDPDRLAPWLYRVARSVLVDRHRRLRPEEPLSDELPDEAPFPEPDVTAQVASWLPAFVDGLPATYREAVRLAELEGLSQREVANRLGLSAFGARSRVQRGRRLVKEALLACCQVQMEAGAVVDVAPQRDCCS